MIQVAELKFKTFSEIRDKKTYFNSDNVIFKMMIGDKRIGVLVKLDNGNLLLEYDGIDIKRGFIDNAYGRIERPCEEQYYEEACGVIVDNYEEFLKYISTNGYRTESRIDVSL